MIVEAISLAWLTPWSTFQSGSRPRPADRTVFPPSNRARHASFDMNDLRYAGRGDFPVGDNSARQLPIRPGRIVLHSVISMDSEKEDAAEKSKPGIVSKLLDFRRKYPWCSQHMVMQVNKPSGNMWSGDNRVTWLN